MSIFSQRKPKQFNYKPVYKKDTEEERNGFSQKMYDQWNRLSYQEVLESGKKRIFTSIAIVAMLALGGIILYEYLIQRLP